jgi:hypothetical protein
MSATGNHRRRYGEAVTALTLSSPRTRRRLTWLGAIALVVGVVVAAAVLLPSRSSVVEHDAATPPAATSAPAQEYKEPPTVPVPRGQINALLDKFIPAVIARKNLAAGWGLVTPEARGKQSEWRRGVTPFQSFPARDKIFRGWRVNYSYPGDVGFDVFLSPTDVRHHVSMAFRGEAKKIGGEWKIAVFYPQATFQPVGKKAFVWADTDLQPQGVRSGAGSGRLSAAWLLVPAGLFGVAIVGGLGFAALAATRRRARVRAIARDLASDR